VAIVYLIAGLMTWDGSGCERRGGDREEVDWPAASEDWLQRVGGELNGHCRPTDSTHYSVCLAPHYNWRPLYRNLIRSVARGSTDRWAQQPRRREQKTQAVRCKSTFLTGHNEYELGVAINSQVVVCGIYYDFYSWQYFVANLLQSSAGCPLSDIYCG